MNDAMHLCESAGDAADGPLLQTLAGLLSSQGCDC